jgi:Raf kinase inhibitor-like YbhB/YbcL family protein
MMKLTSTAFQGHGSIPRRHTCEGEDISPALTIDGVPAGTHSLALIVDDPDAPDPAAPKMTWVHWVLYDLPPETKSLPEGVSSAALHARDGLNDWKQSGYRGPCPPIGRHRYFFKLFALDARLGDLRRPTSAQLQGAFAGHLLAEAHLVGLYEKGRT